MVLYAPNTQEDPTAPVAAPLPAMQLEVIPGTAYDVLNAMHENVIANFRRGYTQPELDFPSIWQLAFHVVGERGPISVYRYRQE